MLGSANQCGGLGGTVPLSPCLISNCFGKWLLITSKPSIFVLFLLTYISYFLSDTFGSIFILPCVESWIVWELCNVPDSLDASKHRADVLNVQFSIVLLLFLELIKHEAMLLANKVEHVQVFWNSRAAGWSEFRRRWSLRHRPGPRFVELLESSPWDAWSKI